MDAPIAQRVFTLVIGIIFSSVMIGFGIPLMKRRIGPNAMVGIRIPATLNNDDVWYEVNAYSGRLSVQSGVIVALLSLLYFIPLIPTMLYFAVVNIGVIAISLIIVVKSMNYVRIVTGEREDRAQTASPLRVGLISSGITLVILMALSAYAWNKIPADKQIITHWGPNGPDGWADKSAALLIWPLALVAGMTVLFGIITWALARAPGIGRQKWITVVAWIVTLLLLMVGHITIVTTALRH